jgi:hypothetical protein
MSDFYYEESLTRRFLNSSSSLLDDDYDYDYDYENINYYDNSTSISIEDEQSQEQSQTQTQEQTAVEHYTNNEQIILSWTARVAGMISFISGLYILCMAYKRRDHVYHRLMLGTLHKREKI